MQRCGRYLHVRVNLKGFHATAHVFEALIHNTLPENNVSERVKSQALRVRG